ncbi:MAG: sodium/pantothenate symporter [Mogibacterium sp.]|nr:sodium/pantothenate symporter [Mogibacterium sp.]
MTGKHLTVLIILMAYLLINLFAGIYMSRKSASENSSKGFLTNYFAGARGMGGFVLAMTLVATYTSASSFLGGPGLAASVGLTQSWIAGVQIGATFLTLGVLGKKFALISRRINAVTITDYLRARYQSDAVVIVCGLALVVFFITQMVAQFIGGATLIQSVTGLPYAAGLLLFGAVVIAYTAFGGFRAVVITDTIQGIVMTIGTFLLMFFVIHACGGTGEIVAQLDAGNPGWDLIGKGEYGREIISMSPGYLLSYWVLVGVAILGIPQTAVRCMGFKDTKAMHNAMIYGTVVVGILMIGMHFIGTMTYPLLPEGGLDSTDKVIPYVVMQYMPGWAAGFFLAAPLAAVMSTVDSLLILASATIIKDLYVHYVVRKPQTAETGKEEEDSESSNSDLMKRVPVYSLIITFVIGVIACLLAFNPPDIIVWINLFAFGGLEATFFWPIIGGLYWKKGNSTACLASTVIGLATFIFFNRVKIVPFHIHEIVVALVVGGIVYFAVGKLTAREPDPEMIRKCF